MNFSFSTTYGNLSGTYSQKTIPTTYSYNYVDWGTYRIVSPEAVQFFLQAKPHLDLIGTSDCWELTFDYSVTVGHSEYPTRSVRFYENEGEIVETIQIFSKSIVEIFFDKNIVINDAIEVKVTLSNVEFNKKKICPYLNIDSLNFLSSSDVSLVVHGKIFPAHSQILKIHSGVFNGLIPPLSTIQTENGSKKFKIALTLGSEISSADFHLFLFRIYNPYLPLTDDIVESLFKLGFLFDVQIITLRCQEFILNNETKFSPLHKALLLWKYDQPLKFKAWNEVNDNYKGMDFFTSEHYQEMSSDQKLSVLEHSITSLRKPERIVFSRFGTPASRFGTDKLIYNFRKIKIPN